MLSPTKGDLTMNVCFIAIKCDWHLAGNSTAIFAQR